MIIVMIEHIIIVFKFGLSAIIKDKPKWVKNEEQSHVENQPSLLAMLELKKAEFKKNGGELIEDQIAKIKDAHKRRQD